MNKYSTNGSSVYPESYETPFADSAFLKKEETKPVPYGGNRFSFEKSPFAFSFESSPSLGIDPRIAGEYVDLLSELHDPTFAETLYEVAAEVEDSFTSRFSSETGGSSLYIPSRLNVENYFSDFLRETDRMMDKVSEHFSANDMADRSDQEVELFFNEIESSHTSFSPAQEQLFGSVFKKVKSAVKKGIDLAKKGVKVLSKLSPVHLLLNRLKKFVRPLLEKVLKFAIGKLPKSFQPHAQTLAKKFLNLETTSYEYVDSDNEIPTTADLETIQTELDSTISELVMSEDEISADELVQNYLQTDELLQSEVDGANGSSLDEARQHFINELRDLQEGESPEPAIERFLPIAMMAVKPIAKMAIGMVGRQRVIDFLAGLITKLIGKYVPSSIADPLSKKIVDIGMTTIGFEVKEVNGSDLAYESIANTIEETIQNLEVDTTNINNEEELAEQLFVSFETAAANNFPPDYIREEVKKTKASGMWVSKPRGGQGAQYKKYTEVFNIEIDPATAQNVKVFRQLPLANFLKDKLGLDVSKPVSAKVHLYQAVNGTRLSQISRSERVAGLGRQPGAWVQLHPLTKEAATLLLKDPGLGKDLPEKYTTKRYKTAVGQRFYYLEISGARLRVPNVQRKNQRTGDSNNTTPGHSGDIQAVLNFVKSEIRLNYYFSEEEARAVVEKLNANDIPGVADGLRNSIKNVLNNILKSNITSKVKLVHETVPELYLEHYPEQQQLSWSDVKGAAKGLVMNAGKEILTKVVEKVTAVLSDSAYKEVLNYFKARAAEFKEAQAQPQDGVTVKIIWKNVQGLAAIGSVIKAIRGNLSFDGLKNLTVPSLPAPEIEIAASKQFE